MDGSASRLRSHYYSFTDIYAIGRSSHNENRLDFGRGGRQVIWSAFNRNTQKSYGTNLPNWMRYS